MKKYISILLALAMVLSLGVPAFAADTHEITSAAFPYYDGESEQSTDMTLYFLDGVNDLPYMEIHDLLALLKNIYHGTVDFSVTAEGPVVTYSRMNSLYDTDVPLSIDFDIRAFIGNSAFNIAS